MKGPMRWALAFLIFAAVATGATMYSTAKFDEARHARIAAEDSDEITVDSIYSDRIEGQYDANYDASRYQTIAKSFESDPIFVDGYQAFEVDDAELEAIRAEINDLDVPIYVAFLSTSKLDDGDGDADLLARRIAAELHVEAATVFVLGNFDEGVGDTGAIRDLSSRPETDPEDSDSAVALSYVRALKAAEVEDATTTYSHTTDGEGKPITVNEDTSEDPHSLAYPAGAAIGGIGLGIIVGGGLGIGGVLGWREFRKRYADT